MNIEKNIKDFGNSIKNKYIKNYEKKFELIDYNITRKINITMASEVENEVSLLINHILENKYHYLIDASLSYNAKYRKSYRPDIIIAESNKNKDGIIIKGIIEIKANLGYTDVSKIDIDPSKIVDSYILFEENEIEKWKKMNNKCDTVYNYYKRLGLIKMKKNYKIKYEKDKNIKFYVVNITKRNDHGKTNEFEKIDNSYTFYNENAWYDNMTYDNRYTGKHGFEQFIKDIKRELD